MRISNTEQTALSASSSNDNVAEIVAGKAADSPDANIIRFLTDDEVSQQVAAHSVLGDMPIPKISPQIDQVASEAGNTLDGLQPQDMTTDLYSILALMVKMYQSQRSADREVRQAGYQRQAEDQYAAANKMIESGTHRMWGAVMSGVGEMAGGVAMVGAGAYSGYQGVQAARYQNQGAEFAGGKDEAIFERFKSQASGASSLSGMASEMGRGASGVLSGAGGLARGFEEKAATDVDAAKMRLETAARMQEQMTQDVSERMSQMQDAIRDALSKLTSLEQARQEINRGISRNL